ncbi:MAG: tyrosine-type recombinase/integrase [Chloroflexota bacterium]
MVQVWAEATTSRSSKRYDDLVRDKTNALLASEDDATVPGFFTYSGVSVIAATEQDIETWIDALRKAGLAQATIYARVSRVSSFYNWLSGGGHLPKEHNPAQAARPAAPKAYTSDKAQPLTEADVQALLAVVRDKATSKSRSAISAKRDEALLRFYFTTGKKRAEIIALRFGDILINEDSVWITTDDPPTPVPGARGPLVTYLKASERWSDTAGVPSPAATAPIWLRHDRAAKGQQGVTSHGFVFMLKKYAKAAGLGNINLNQTRHTAALRISGDIDSVEEAQQRLGYQSRSMARVYLKHLRGDNGDES